MVAAGLQLDFKSIEGAVEAIEDPDCPAGSMYTLDYAYEFAKQRENF